MKPEKPEKPVQIAQIAQLAFIALASLTVYMFVTAAQDGEARASCTALCALHPNYANQDRAAPDFELPGLDGKPVKLSSFRGRPVVLNFWTKTCKPCLEEMPALSDLGVLLEREGAVLLTVNTDESADDARTTLRAVLGHEPTFAVLSDPESNVVAGKFGTKLYPETWVIDPDGVIRARFDGPRDWSSPLVLDVVRMVAHKSGCGIQFDRGRPRGDRRGLCGDVAPVPEE